MKQSKLRRRRVLRYSILYFVMLVVFVGLMVGPVVGGSRIPTDQLEKMVGRIQLLEGLFQPPKQDNDDTDLTKQTGTGRDNYDGVLASQIEASRSAAASASPSSTDEEAKRKRSWQEARITAI
jgi:1,3-beta-glucan synthase